MFPDSANPFIPKQTKVDWWPIENGCIYYCSYDVTMYKPALFSELEIQGFSSVKDAVTKRQAEYLAGRYCAKMALRSIGIDNVHVPTGQNREPLWPNNIKGSISHVNDSAIACVSDSRSISGIGIDIEQILGNHQACSVEKMILTEQDYAHFNESNLTKEYFVTLLFSIKESFFKAAYPLVNEYFDFQVLSFSSMDTTLSTVELKLTQTLCKELQSGFSVVGHFKEISPGRIVSYVKLSK